MLDLVEYLVNLARKTGYTQAKLQAQLSRAEAGGMLPNLFGTFITILVAKAVLAQMEELEIGICED